MFKLFGAAYFCVTTFFPHLLQFPCSAGLHDQVSCLCSAEKQVFSWEFIPCVPLLVFLYCTRLFDFVVRGKFSAVCSVKSTLSVCIHIKFYAVLILFQHFIPEFRAGCFSFIFWNFWICRRIVFEIAVFFQLAEVFFVVRVYLFISTSHEKIRRSYSK